MKFTAELWTSIETTYAAMRQHFLVTSRYEWMFWEMGYRRESWPL